MSLLIGSVYIDHPRSKLWYDLQIKYLEKTTINYKHMVYVNGKDNFYNKSTVLKMDNSPIITGCSQQNGHVRGLNAIVNYFKENDQYENLLLLDSDCFPIANGWQNNLIQSMKNFKVAAVVRCENLDTFAHPCVFLVKREKINDLKFGIFPQTNIAGYKFRDTSSNVTEFFPMIRTNKINYDQILCGLYWDYFYHHGAGSRNLTFRIFGNYFKENNNLSSKESKLFEESIKNPDAFMKKLGAPVTAKKIY